MKTGGSGETFVTILFTDLVGSTSLFQRDGDDAADVVRRENFAAQRRAVAEHGGREIKSTGDGLMVAFASAVAAVRCAVDMQRAMADTPGKLALRVGLDAGEPLADGEDLYGTPVIVASRLCDAAGAGQILATEVVRHVAGPRVDQLMRSAGELRLHGITKPVGVADIRWQETKPKRAPTAPRSDHMAPALQYQLLGPVEALVEGRAVELGGPRQRGVLVVLLTQAGSLVPASRIIDAVWGDEPPDSAANLVQRSVSQLRKALGRDAIETRGAGYMVRVEPDALDLHVFERLARAGSVALHDGRFEEATVVLREALALWRGAALADLADQPFLDHEAARLEEMRLLALERALEADLACGRHADALAEAEGLVHAHRLRERPRELVMRALYGTGRQAEALEAYRRTRATFVEELGIEPGPALRELEQAILRQDESLAPQDPTVPAPPRSGADRLRTLLVAPLGTTAPQGLTALAERLARQPPREIVLAETVPDGRELVHASRRLHESREALSRSGLEARAAVFTSVTPGADLARLATEQDVDLLLSDAPEQLLEDGRLLTLLERAPCDVGVLVGTGELRGPVLVPFAGAAHDWTAVEIGAWLARNSGEPLLLAGASTGPEGRDASRLLANASLAVQHALGVPTEPLLVNPEPEALVSAAADAGLVAIGLTERWRREGLGRVRTALATAATFPVLLVRRGVRPGGLAPRDSDTRFTWTVAGT
jgi:DNA-binding SARP family transcriptional activator/class 3 adenylate cyclase